MISHRQFFGDADRDFTLGADQILELERKTGVGIGGLVRRVSAGEFTLTDIVETIRLGLVGGGTEPQEAAALITTYVTARPIEHGMILATDILSALYFGASTTTAPAKRTRRRKAAT